MDLFRRRPLALSCLIFMIFSAISYSFGVSKLSIVIITSILFTCIFLSFLLKKYRSKFFVPILCVLFATVAVLNMYLSIDMKAHRAEEVTGNRTVSAVILDELSSGKNYSEYVVRLEGVEDNRINFKALMVIYYNTDLEIGDRIYARSELISMSQKAMGKSGYERTDENDIYIMALIYDTDDMLIYPNSEPYPPFTHEWFVDIGISFQRSINELKEKIHKNLFDSTDDSTSALAYCFLTGEKDHIDTVTVRDFRRSGISHLLAVSGLHVSILLGSVDIILRKLYVSKRIRIPIICVLAFFLLLLTGFSKSAMRAVFMLGYVYLSFAFSEENDPPTSLFLAAAVIILLSPHSIGDIGFLMSFSATLGLVTFYSFYNTSIRTNTKEAVKKHKILKIPLYLLYAVLLTLTANIFILPITYLYFGEFSIISILANIVISPIAYVFLLLIPFIVIFGQFGFIGNILSTILSFVGNLLTFFASEFSDIPFSTVSLRYNFVAIIVLIVTVGNVIFLCVRLKHKWITALPSALGIVAFCICIAVFNATDGRPTLHVSCEDNDSIISISENSTASLIITSKVNYQGYRNSFETVREYGATEIENIIITNIDDIYTPTLEYFIKNNVIRNIYIVPPTQKQGTANTEEIIRSCKELGINCFLLEENTPLILSNNTGMSVVDAEGENTLIAISSNEVTLLYRNGTIYTTDMSKSHTPQEDVSIKLYK